VADEEAVRRLLAGVEGWNRWRREEGIRMVDLRSANLGGAALGGVVLSQADLTYAVLTHADLAHADLRGAHLSHAALGHADLTYADLRGAHLSHAVLGPALLGRAELHGANLSGADLRGARLVGADLSEVVLNGADLSAAQAAYTQFTNMDLRGVLGLDSIEHRAPSTVGVDTLYRSAGQIPEAFLRGCGVPDAMIAYLPSLVGGAINFYSCFISYSTKDDTFARRLHERLRAEQVRVWFAPEELKGGEKLHEQIDRAIELHDRLLLVLSEHSLASRWVVTEVRRALEQERRQQRRKLFPILVGSYDILAAWDAFDPGSGTYLRDEIAEYLIPDFSHWKDHDAFEAAFTKLLRDLRATEGRPA
jgi:hypothetical protein